MLSVSVFAGCYSSSEKSIDDSDGFEPYDRIAIFSGDGSTKWLCDEEFLSEYGFDAPYKTDHVTIYLSSRPNSNNYIMMTNEEYVEWKDSDDAAKLRGDQSIALLYE